MRRKQHREVSIRTPPRRMNPHLRLPTEHNLTSPTAEAEEVTEAVDNSEEDTKEASNKVEAKVSEVKVDKINEDRDQAIAQIQVFQAANKANLDDEGKM